MLSAPLLVGASGLGWRPSPDLHFELTGTDKLQVAKTLTLLG
jgi:hypothetical protein